MWSIFAWMRVVIAHPGLAKETVKRTQSICYCAASNRATNVDLMELYFDSVSVCVYEEPTEGKTIK